ncbi:MAG: ribonuclease Z [Chloroflexota bacterium]
MFELVFLGTSASAPSIHRGMPALAVLAGEHRYLVDCGEGTQRQILQSGIGFKKLNNILITHAHLDHILGLGGLVSTFTSWEDIHDLRIWGGRSTLSRINRLLFGVVLDYDRIDVEIDLIELQQAGQIAAHREFTVRAFPVTHRGSGNFAYTFKEHDYRPFLVEKAEALGVPAGPERGRLVTGEAVTLADGTVVNPEDVIGEAEEGAKVVVTGDIARTDNILHEVEGANTLVIESTFLDVDAGAAKAFGHITAKQAAQFAKDAGVQNLIINHVSRRYRERDIIDEARAIFPNAYVARDFDHYAVRRGQPVIRNPEKSN